MIEGLPYDKLLAALLYTEDVFDRAQIPFMLLQQQAIQAKQEQNISGTAVNCGVLKKHLTEYQIPILKSVLPQNTIYMPNRITFFHDGVPIHVKIISRNYKFFQNPNTVFWSYETFQIPNPIEEYWRVRYFIK